MNLFYNGLFATLLLTVTSLFAGPFTLSKDSVFEVISNVKPDTVFMQNNTSSILTIDSVVVLFDTVQMPTCEIAFRVFPDASIRSGGFQYWYGRTSHYVTLALNPNETIKLTYFQFDLCISCPTVAKLLASSQVPVGDTISGALVFYANNFKDTLKIKGVRSIWSTGIIQSSQSKPSINPVRTVISDHSVDLAGRKTNVSISCGYKVRKNHRVLNIRK